MSALTAINPTYMDLANLMDPDGSIPKIVEILRQKNQILEDMTWQEGNLLDGHQTTVRTDIPTPTWTKFYGFVSPTKSGTAQIVDRTARMTSFTEIDADLAKLNNNSAAWRMSEELAQVQGLNNELASKLFFGNAGVTPEHFTGIAPRFNSLTDENADNLISGGGANGQTDCGSIYLICWSPNTIHGIVPKGMKAGLQIQDLGEETKESGNGLLRVLRSKYTWNVGLCLRDWRYIVRIHSIDKSTLTNVFTSGTFSGSANLPDLMYQAMRLLPDMNEGRCAFYMSRDMATWVARQRAAMGLVGTFTPNTAVPGSGWTDTFDGVPIRRVDVLSADEDSLN